jgi:WD40 repeat protein
MSHVNAHSDVVIDMEFVFESCMLLTASADHTVRLWRSCLQTPHNNKLGNSNIQRQLYDNRKLI